MLSMLLIGPEDNLVRDWKEKAAGLRNLYICHQVLKYPSPSEVMALVDEFAPDAVVINLADYPQVCRSIGRLSLDRPQLPIIGLHTCCDQELLLDLMQLGVRELWFQPLKLEQLQNGVNRLEQQKRAAAPERSKGQVVAFLPARGGCGSTTIAVNTSGALRKLSDSVLFADFDFHNSVIAFWLKLDPRHGFQEALERAHTLDSTLWKGIVHPVGGLDVLTAPQIVAPMVFTSSETGAVLDYASQTYDHVLVDLPDAIYSSCWEVLNRARFILLTVTPEMACLYMARRKIGQLVGHGISAENIRILLNRSSQVELQGPEIEKFLSVSVVASFHNQYRTVTNAFTEGKFVPESSKLGAQYARLAESLAGIAETQEKPSAVRRLRQIFSPA